MTDLRKGVTSLTLATWPGRLAPQHNERTTLNRDNRDTWGHVVTARHRVFQVIVGSGQWPRAMQLFRIVFKDQGSEGLMGTEKPL